MVVETFPTWLKRQMKLREWTQADLARKGFAQSTVSAWVRGVRLPDAVMSDKLADVFGVDRDFVFNLTGIRPEENDDSEEMRSLVSKLRRVELTPERLSTLNLILDSMVSFSRNTHHERGGE